MGTETWEAEFTGRLESRQRELRALFDRLYPGDAQAYSYFVDMLHRMYQDRSESLRALDRKRMAAPDWYREKDMLGMQMYVREFAGTLKGVQRRLDYIEECGVRCLHLMPLLCSPEGRSDGGYAVSDFRRVEPEVGTMEELAELADACHARDIAVCLDFVMNHTSEDHAWAVAARQGDRSAQERYFFFDDWSVPSEYERTVPQVFPTTAPGSFSWCPEVGKVVMTTFYPYQWDLNYANPTVFNDMTENMLYLTNRGIDVIRLDAVPYIWKEKGTTCRNLPQVHILVRLMRLACEIVCPGTLLLGEVVMEPSKVVPYFGSLEQPECHLLYNVTTMASIWHTVATKDVRLLRHQLRQVFALPKEYSFLNYLRCHDDIGWGLDYDFLAQFGVEQIAHKRFLNDYLTGRWPGSPARGELYNDDPRLGDARLCGTTASLCGVEAARYERDEAKTAWAVREDLMLHAFMLSLSGLPILYSGDEIAKENDYTYHRDPLRADDSRYLHRGKMDWSAAEARKLPGRVEHTVFTTLRRLETVRGEHRVFEPLADTWLPDTGDDGVLCIGRFYENEKFLGLYNFSPAEKTVDLRQELGDYTDLMTGKPQPKDAVTLPAGGFMWLCCDFEALRSEEAKA